MTWPPPKLRAKALRLYLVLAVLWVSVWGCVAVTSHIFAERHQYWVQHWYESIQKLERDPTLAEKERASNGANSEDYNSLLKQSAYEKVRALHWRKLALIALPSLPIALPTLWLVFLCIAAVLRLRHPRI